MKNLYTILFLCFSLGAMCQTTFYTESFESTTGYSFPNGSGVGSSNQDFFGRTDSVSAPPQETFTYSGFDGTFFIAGEDINGAITGSVGEVYIDNIDISGKLNLQFTAAFASGTDIDIDGVADSISVAVKIDNGAWIVIGRFRADSSTFTSSSGPFNGQFAEDTNGDGYGDGVQLAGNFTDFTWPIIGSGDSLDIRISMDLQSGDEEAAFDNIRISGLTTLGVGEIVFDENTINLFPNPTTGIINIETLNNEDLAQLISLEGKLLKEIQINDNQVQLNLSEFANGIYFLKVGGITRKVILSK
ncbi:T9SS type A sorting domain-containing protein [bacterium]|nr:T9SS type A sorting domain-containing protein [bacterium]